MSTMHRMGASAKLFFFLGSAIVLIGGAFFLINQGQSKKDAASFYANALKDAGIPVVTTSEAELKLAYERALAERAPLLDIAGTDPQTLKQNADLLESIEPTLQKAQKNESDKALIKTIYPIRFLRSLAALEQARQVFVASGLEADAKRYEVALSQAIADGLSDAQTFQKSVASLADPKNPTVFRIASLSGTITQESLMRSAEAVVTRMQEVQARFAKRQQCLGGDVRACESQALVAQYPEVVSGVSDRLPAQARDIHNALNAAYPNHGQENDPVLTLAHSACLALYPPPYVFTLHASRPNGGVPLEYIGNLFFYLTANNGATLAYLKKTYGVDYGLMVPLEFYECPEVLSDVGRAKAIEATAQFAKEFPQYASAERNRLLSAETLNEPNAAAYLATVGKEIGGNGPETAAFQTLLLEWRDSGAGLETVVKDVVNIDSKDAAMNLNGIPFSVDAKLLLATHSGFLSLFLAQNPSAGSTAVPFFENNQSDFKALLQKVTTYSALVDLIPRDKIIHDLAGFFAFENKFH